MQGSSASARVPAAVKLLLSRSGKPSRGAPPCCELGTHHTIVPPYHRTTPPLTNCDCLWPCDCTLHFESLMLRCQYHMLVTYSTAPVSSIDCPNVGCVHIIQTVTASGLVITPFHLIMLVFRCLYTLWVSSCRCVGLDTAHHTLVTWSTLYVLDSSSCIK